MALLVRHQVAIAGFDRGGGLVQDALVERQPRVRLVAGAGEQVADGVGHHGVPGGLAAGQRAGEAAAIGQRAQEVLAKKTGHNETSTCPVRTGGEYPVAMIGSSERP